NRAWISDQRAQTGIGEVLGWVHRQIQIGASRRRSCLVHRVACEAFVHEEGLPVSRRMEGREHGINSERGPPLGWCVLHRQTDNLVGPHHGWDGWRLIAEPYDIEGACALILTWNWRPRP